MSKERSAAITIGGKEYELVLTTRATKEIAGRYGGESLLIGVPGDAGLGVADDFLLIKFIGALPHPPGELPLGGAQLEILPGDGYQQQNHAVQQQQAAHQVLVGIAVSAAHQAHHAQQPAQAFGPAGFFLSDTGLRQPVQGGEGLDVIGGVIDKGIQ